MDELKRYNRFVSDLFKRVPFHGLFDYKRKEDNAFAHVLYMLNRTQAIFTYEGLPDSIPARMLELYLQVAGCCCITEVNGELYALTGGLGGEPDAYYMPTIFTVANPALRYSASLRIGEDCIVINNDSMYIGLMPMFNRHASLMAETELSLQIALINSRIIDLIAAEDDATKESAELFLKRIASGELGVIASSAFLEGLKTVPYGSSGRGNELTQLIETEQYIKAAWFNDLGLNANYNMKREALSTAESQLNDDALLPLIDNMLLCREQALAKVNEKYGTDIKVKLASSWEDNQIETDAELDALVEEDPGEDPGEEDPEDKEVKEDE